jgi:hypothetical protein
MKNLLCKNMITGKSKEVEIGWCNQRQIWQTLLKEAMGQRGLFAHDDDDDVDDLSLSLTSSRISYFHAPLIRLVAN